MFDYESFVEAEWVLLGYRWGKWSVNKGSCNKSSDMVNLIKKFHHVSVNKLPTIDNRMPNNF